MYLRFFSDKNYWNMEKRLFLLGGLAAVAATGCARQSEAPARPMNILYIMTDDLSLIHI